MSPLACLLKDVDGSLGRGSGEDRARTLARITDLFVDGADDYGPEEVELFDSVIQRFAAAIETRARVELAERLAPLGNGPRGVLLTLAHDEIVVARPVLSHSPRLYDQDLMAIAVQRGRDHMLAICDRPKVSESVTDVLVHQGDGVVRHAIAGNLGARFSLMGAATLIDHSRGDAALQELLGDRPDLSPTQAGQLVTIAKETARRHLTRSLPGADGAIAAAVDRGASAVEAVLDKPRRPGPTGLSVFASDRDVTETDLARYAAERRSEQALGALATLTGLAPDCIDRIFEERDNDLLLVIGKARGWSWGTVRLLLQLRDPRLSERHHFRRAEETFDGLATATAQRVLHFLKVREATAPHGSRAEPRWLSGA